MAIQNRRGIYTDFDPTKLLPGEYAIVQSGDPNSTTGYAIYMCFASGTVKRIALIDDLDETTGGAEELVENVIATGYSPSSTYAVGDYCINEGYLYRCNTTISVAEAWTPGHWTQVKIGTRLNALEGSISDIASDISDIETALSGKQDTLTFDNAPNAYSGRPVKSSGIKSAIDAVDFTSHLKKDTGTRSLVVNAVTNNQATGDYSLAEGYSTKATANYAHAEGQRTTASQSNAHAEGMYTIASGSSSHAEGRYTEANHQSQHVFGTYNVLDPSTAGATAKGTYVEIVGNGTGTNARSNARTLDWDGNEVLAGKLTVGVAPTADMDVTTKKYVDDKAVEIDDTLSVSGKAADAKAAGDAIAEKASVDGYYEEMAVGSAEQLIATTYVNDKVPYLFRASGGGADVGNRVEDTIVGGTVAWNQICPAENGSINPNQGTKSFDSGVWTLTCNVGSASAFGFYTTGNIILRKDRKSLAIAKVKMSISTEVRFGTDAVYVRKNITANQWTELAIIISPANNAALTCYSNASSGNTMEVKEIMVFDLTAMFGSTIADYIYALETATAGAGVAYFRKLFPKLYYEYNAGTLKSVEGLVSHDMIGFNQWDEEWENGDIDSTTGENVQNSSLIRSKNYIEVIPGTTYYFRRNVISTDTIRARFYDANRNYIGFNDNNGETVKGNLTFVTPISCRYMRFAMPIEYGTTYKHDICINLSWSGYRNGEYEPYEKHSYPLDSSLTLRGIPKVDANGMYFDGDVYLPSGEVQRRYAVVDLGTLDWTYGTFGSATVFTSGVMSSAKSNFEGISSKYPKVDASVVYANNSDKIMCANNQLVRIIDSAYTDAATFKTVMSGVYLVYELATATTETATPYQSLQLGDDFGTEEYVIDSDVAIPVPVGHDSKYLTNLRDKLQHLPELAGSDGTYLVKQTGTQMTLTPFPAVPSANGTYVLKATVSGGSATLSWEVET